jgi:hypothetical protein
LFGSYRYDILFNPVISSKEVINLYTGSIAFWGQKAGCWDSPKPLKVSGIFLTNLRLGNKTRCLPVQSSYILFFGKQPTEK